ncbi:MAG: helicase, partial [Epsilonproteobacteria bacterium]
MNNLDKKLEELYQKKESIELEIKLLEKKKQESTKSYIILEDSIYINISHLSKVLIQSLQNLAIFENPQVQILQNLRKPLYNIPRTIKGYEQTKSQLIIPRGLMRGVIELFKQHKLDTTYIDKRFIQEEIFLNVTYKLRDEQTYAIEAINKKDFSLCIAPPGFGKTLIGAKMIELRAVNTLIIVNKNMLLDQWIDRFIEYFKYEKKDIGFLGKSKNKLNNKLDIATMQ